MDLGDNYTDWERHESVLNWTGASSPRRASVACVHKAKPRFPAVAHMGEQTRLRASWHAPLARIWSSLRSPRPCCRRRRPYAMGRGGDGNRWHSVGVALASIGRRLVGCEYDSWRGEQALRVAPLGRPPRAIGRAPCHDQPGGRGGRACVQPGGRYATSAVGVKRRLSRRAEAGV